MKLNIACGKDVRPGWINADLYGGEIQCDAAHLPFKNETFDEILSAHTLEHVFDFTGAVIEMHRVLKPEAMLTIIVPYGLKSLHNLDHVRWFHLKAMDKFCHPSSGIRLPDAPLFYMVKRWISAYRFPFTWHIHEHLPWLVRPGRLWMKFFAFTDITDREFSTRTRFHLPLGRRNEITFRLRKR